MLDALWWIGVAVLVLILFFVLTTVQNIYAQLVFISGQIGLLIRGTTSVPDPKQPISDKLDEIKESVERIVDGIGEINDRAAEAHRPIDPLIGPDD